MNNSVPFIRLKNISKEFPGVQALDNVSFDVFPGEIVAVIGENGAGKSTLMNILAGVLQPDGGEIILSGESQVIDNPNVSQKLGINVVYQEMSNCPNLGIAENISLVEISRHHDLSFVNRDKVYKDANKVLSRLSLKIGDLDTPVGDISVAHQQIIEIAKAISTNARLIIFDEPTSALTEEDTQQLFKIIRDLKRDGVSILYVSHRFEEIIELADRIVVLRNGKLVNIMDKSEATVENLIEKVAGRAIDDLYKTRASNVASDKICMEISQLSDGLKVDNISFKVNKCMILGIAGLPDSGKDELGECLYGLRNYQGSILVDGDKVVLKSPTDAIKSGISYVPANRHEAGAILKMNVEDNIIASNLKGVNKLGFLQKNNIFHIAKKFVNDLHIKVSKITQLMNTISGGNQQKIILSRCLATNPVILLLHEPTRGIDVGSKAEIYAILENLAKNGVAIVIISSELTELMSHCNQILVMYNGKLQGDFKQEDFEEKKIISCLMGEAVCL